MAMSSSRTRGTFDRIEPSGGWNVAAIDHWYTTGPMPVNAGTPSTGRRDQIPG
jgi:hypothetical protein